MTNQEKAKEIAEKTHTVWRDEEGEDISSQDDCYNAAMEMAQWKDKQIAKLKAQNKSLKQELRDLSEEFGEDFCNF